MADSYLAISQIADDVHMANRMRAAVAQEQLQGHVVIPLESPAPYNVSEWVAAYRYQWASQPTWGEKWKYALDSHSSDPTYQPGRDEAVITDADILAVVQAML